MSILQFTVHVRDVSYWIYLKVLVIYVIVFFCYEYFLYVVCERHQLALTHAEVTELTFCF